MRICIVCEELKSIIDFPNYKSFSPNDKRKKVCKLCTAKKEKERREKQKDKSQIVLYKPNTYFNQEQKDLTFKVMEALGFTFLPHTGIWYKEGFKNPDGTFVQVEKNKRLNV